MKCAINVSVRMFLFLAAALLPIGPLLAEPVRIQGVEVDDLPLLGPYLLTTESPHDSIRIAFRGTEPDTLAADGMLSYGVKAVQEKTTTSKAAASHVVELKNLKPGTIYQYQLKLGAYESPVYHFRTAPAPGVRAEKIKALILSDFHVHSPKDATEKPAIAASWYRRYAEKMADFRKFGPDLVLLSGDFVHVGERRDEYETMLRLMRDVYANAVVLPCPGNHERQKDPKLANYADYFPDPSPVQRTGAWATAYGGIGIAVHGTGPWLKQALARLKTDGKADTLFYMQHAPIYLWSDKDTTTGGNTTSNLFDEVGDVRLCIYGHFHMHQRTLPLLKNAVVTEEKTTYGPETKGTIYLQIPSVWYQYAYAKEDAFVARNGVLSEKGPCTGYTEMTITPEKIVTETYGYSDASKRELIDQFTLIRPKQ